MRDIRHVTQQHEELLKVFLLLFSIFYLFGIHEGAAVNGSQVNSRAVPRFF